MDKIIIFHGRPVEQRTCDLCGRVIYLEENMHRVRRRCRSYVKAYPMYISLNKKKTKNPRKNDYTINISYKRQLISVLKGCFSF